MNSVKLLAAALALFVAGAAMADTDPRTITVTGEGRVEVTPDMAVITLGVTNEAIEAGVAMAATSNAVGKILERITGLGIAAKDVQTRNLSLNPVWSNRNRSSDSGRSEITGFVASNSVLVRVRDLAGLGDILDAVVADGANDFNGLQFGIQQPDPLADKALQAAVVDATGKAGLLAEAAKVTLGPVMTLSENGGGRPRPMALEMAAARDASVPIAAGELTIAASVTMVFLIAD